jgi:hypothetical protein
MKKFLVVIFFCLPAFGQAAYSGLGLYSGSATYAASSSSSCAAPNFCAYTGTDVIPWGTVPNFGGSTNNNAAAYDTSYVGRGGFSSANLSPITRLTDSVSAYGKTNANFTAGMGGSGVFTLTNTNTSLVRVDQNSLGLICAFNTSGPNQGHCGTPSGGWGGTPPSSGIFITTGQLSGGTCSTNCPVNDFGSISFSLTDPTVLYTFGNDAYDISSATTVTPYTINPETGVYSVGSPLVDFQYGLPLGSNAPNWTANTAYPYGAYVTHVLNAPGTSNPEYLAYTAATSYNPGDIIVPGGAGTCMYRAIVAGTTNGTLATSFSSGSACKNDIVKEAAPSTLQWRGTNSAAQFVYQNTGTAGTSTGSAFQWVATPSTLATDGSITSGAAVLTSSSNPFTASQVGQAISVSGSGNNAGTTPLYTTILSYQNAGQVTLATTALHTVTTSATIALTGHPDTLTSTNADRGGVVWTNVGPSYTIANGSQSWQAPGGISRDTAYGGYASQYGIAISTNSYGTAPTYSKYTADQGSGFWAIEYDEVSNIYHLLNTATGIWTDWSCASGSGYNCPRTGTTVGTLSAFSNPFLTGQSCPFYIHNLKLSSNGLYAVFTSQADVYPACTSLSSFGLWQTTTASFDAVKSFQFTFAGLNHWAIGANKVVAFNSSGWGYTAGVFIGTYNANNVQGANGAGGFAVGVGYPPPFSVYLNPLASQSTPQTTPPGCYVTVGSTIKNPDCNLSEILDSHLSWVGDPGTDTYPACGTSYNYATLGPAFNAWQNMETCYQTSPTYPTGYAPPAAYSLPSTSVGNVWQFSHTFATGTSVTFSTQFQISEYSQDANWLFWSSDWNCQNGATTGVAPTVYSGSGTYFDMLAVTAVPAGPTSVCGLPWAASTTYVVGNMINPIEGTSGSGAVDDVFQAIYVGGPTGSTQPGPTLPNSYFSTSMPPSVAPVSITAATESGTTVTITSTLNPAVGANVNISGVTPFAYNGTWVVLASSATNFTYANTASGLGNGTALGTASAAGSTICDGASSASMNPPLPYSTSCLTGTVWQDIGPQNQRGDVFAVNLGNQR